MSSLRRKNLNKFMKEQLGCGIFWGFVRFMVLLRLNYRLCAQLIRSLLKNSNPFP